MTEDPRTIAVNEGVASTAKSPATRLSVTEQRLGEIAILPVIELEDAGQALELLAALREGGMNAGEITLRTVSATTTLERLLSAYPDALLGAGTVRNLEDARRVVDLGVSFVASPGTDEAVITYCLEHDVLALPGVCTPTEVLRALGAGASILKLFPAEASGGVSYLKALTGPFRDVKFVPTGGVSATNLESYLRVAQVTACGGSWMVAPELLAAGRFDEVARLAREAVDIVEEVRRER